MFSPFKKDTFFCRWRVYFSKINTFFAIGVSVRGIGGEDMHLANHRQSVVLSTFHTSTSYPDYIIMKWYHQPFFFVKSFKIHDFGTCSRPQAESKRSSLKNYCFWDLILFNTINSDFHFERNLAAISDNMNKNTRHFFRANMQSEVHVKYTLWWKLCQQKICSA